LRRTEAVWWRRGSAGVIAGVLAVAVIIMVVVLASSSGGSGGGYTVRAIFDDAGNLIPGEDAKIGGVKVGTVKSVTATPTAKAAVVIAIENPGFQDFRKDATCRLRPQALIGEKYVDCLPTQPRVDGMPLPPPLRQLEHNEPGTDEGAGEYYLPVTNTSSPVDIDQLQDITRLPEAQRLRIILNEFGAGLAGRGSDLSEVVRRANPTLREFDDVLKILASENHVLVNLAEEGDRALAPIAADREKVADFIVQSNTVAKAAANQRAALAKDFAYFPAFLRQLEPALRRLGAFAEQTTPTFTDLGIAAPAIDKLFQNQPGFANSSTAFFKSFGKNSKIIGPALSSLEPILGKLETLGSAAKPFASNFANLLTNVRSTGGLERLLDLIFLGAGATNGYDSLGHFLRGEGVVTPCTTYAITPAAACSAKFSATAAEARLPGDPATTSRVMERTLAVLDGATPAQAIAEYPGSVAGETGPGSVATPGAATETTQPVGGAAAGTTYYTPTEENGSAGGALLNYLLGN
jgi:ABC-type transporter Mla subunit MlaD